MNHTFTAVARSQKVLEISVDKEFCSSKLSKFYLYIDGKRKMELTSVSQSESHSSHIYTFMLNNSPFLVGKKYEIVTEQNYFIPVDISFLALDDAFDEKYRYDGQLGAIYTKEKTTFRVFSPFATRIILIIQRKNGSYEETFTMRKDSDTGIFEITVDGDLDEAKYIYEAEIFSKIHLRL